MKLTFKKYLVLQCKLFANSNIVSFSYFAKISRNNARLKDNLCLYLMLYASNRKRKSMINSYPYLKNTCDKLVGINKENIVSFIKDKDKSEFYTIYNNFLYELNYKEKEQKLKEIMYNAILSFKQEKHITNHYISKNLKINLRKINAFINNKDIEKISLEQVRKILKLVKEY